MTTFLIIISFVVGLLVGANNTARVRRNSKRIEDALVKAIEENQRLKNK